MHCLEEFIPQQLEGVDRGEYIVATRYDAVLRCPVWVWCSAWPSWLKIVSAVPTETSVRLREEISRIDTAEMYNAQV